MAETVVLTPSRQGGWVLDQIATDLQSMTGGRIFYIPQSRRDFQNYIRAKFVPRANIAIFLHQDIFFEFHKTGKIGYYKKSTVFFTHPGIVDDAYILKLRSLRVADRIIVCSRQMKYFLVNLIGDSVSEKISVRMGGVNTIQFSDKKMTRESNSVILVSKYNARKNGDLLLETLQNSPEFNFTLHGRNWENYGNFELLISQPNFRYRNFEYSAACDLYNANHTFLSLSHLEGAPMPALEALSSGCRLVLTDTGFAQDLALLSHSVIVIPVASSASEVNIALLSARSRPKPDAELHKHYNYVDFLREFWTTA